MTEYPWSPGPWSMSTDGYGDDIIKAADGSEVAGAVCTGYSGECSVWIENDANAALITLASQMAEFILADYYCLYSDIGHQSRHCECPSNKDIIEKLLRLIGKELEE